VTDVRQTKAYLDTAKWSAYARFVDTAEALVDAGRNLGGDIDFDILNELENDFRAYLRALDAWVKGPRVISERATFQRGSGVKGSDVWA
jgi:hypothetical protein